MVVECIKVNKAFFNYVGCHVIKIGFTQAWRAREASTLVSRRVVMLQCLPLFHGRKSGQTLPWIKGSGPALTTLLSVSRKDTITQRMPKLLVTSLFQTGQLAMYTSFFLLLLTYLPFCKLYNILNILYFKYNNIFNVFNLIYLAIY